jgi:hypothetical protein
MKGLMVGRWSSLVGPAADPAAAFHLSIHSPGIGLREYLAPYLLKEEEEEEEEEHASFVGRGACKSCVQKRMQRVI